MRDFPSLTSMSLLCNDRETSDGVLDHLPCMVEWVGRFFNTLVPLLQEEYAFGTRGERRHPRLDALAVHGTALRSASLVWSRPLARLRFLCLRCVHTDEDTPAVPGRIIAAHAPSLEHLAERLEWGDTLDTGPAALDAVLQDVSPLPCLSQLIVVGCVGTGLASGIAALSPGTIESTIESITSMKTVAGAFFSTSSNALHRLDPDSPASLDMISGPLMGKKNAPVSVATAHTPCRPEKLQVVHLGRAQPSILAGLGPITELSSLTASSTVRRLGIFFQAMMAVEESANSFWLGRQRPSRLAAIPSLHRLILTARHRTSASRTPATRAVATVSVASGSPAARRCFQQTTATRGVRKEHQGHEDDPVARRIRPPALRAACTCAFGTARGCPLLRFSTAPPLWVSTMCPSRRTCVGPCLTPFLGCISRPSSPMSRST